MITHAITGVTHVITAPPTVHFKCDNAGLLLKEQYRAIISIINVIAHENARPFAEGPARTNASRTLIKFTAVRRAAALSSLRSRDGGTPRCMFVGY